MRRYAWIPYGLILLRAVAGPVAIALTLLWGPAAGAACAILLAVGVLSDIFDGVVARRIGSATPDLRTLDSRADLVFWICMAAAVMLMHPPVAASLIPMALGLGALVAAAHAVSWLRFRRESSPHHLMAKLLGLALWALLTQLFLTGQGGWLQTGVFWFGVVSELEAVAIMAVLPAWQTDVISLGRAFEIRRAARAAQA